jgi:hypothetical protein
MNQTDNKAPSLDHLDYETRVRIAVAETQGATWKLLGGGGWFLFNSPEAAADAEKPIIVGVRIQPTPGFRLFVYAHPDLAEPIKVYPALPDSLNDPAAWGALMEKERIAVTPNTSDTWVATSEFGACTANSVGAAICAAVLAKYGEVITPSTTEAKP